MKKKKNTNSLTLPVNPKQVKFRLVRIGLFGKMHQNKIPEQLAWIRAGYSVTSPNTQHAAAVIAASICPSVSTPSKRN